MTAPPPGSSLEARYRFTLALEGMADLVAAKIEFEFHHGVAEPGLRSAQDRVDLERVRARIKVTLRDLKFRRDALARLGGRPTTESATR